MPTTRYKWLVLPVLVFGSALWVWQASRESDPPGAEAAPPQVLASAEIPPVAAPAEAIGSGDEQQSPIPQVVASPSVSPPSSPPTSGKQAPASPPTNPTPGTEEGWAGARQDLAHLQFMIRDFRLMLGGNPVGNNEEIVRALLGRNPKEIRLELPPGRELSAGGELLDPWGTPYFFHQLSAKEMEIRCAGPDRILWNSDDLSVQ